MSTPGLAHFERGTFARDMPRCDRGSRYDNIPNGAPVSDPLARARALMALALSTHSTEEARTTALIALRLIDKHKLLDAKPAATAPSAPRPRENDYTSPEPDWFREAVRRANENRTASRTCASRAARRPPSPPKRPEAPPGCGWVRARSAYVCRICNESVAIGETIMVEHGKPIHEQCWIEANGARA